MNLYKIDEQLRLLMESEEIIDSDTGELLEGELSKRLGELLEAQNATIEDFALQIKELVAEAASIGSEEKALAARRKAKESRAKSLQNSLSDYLLSHDTLKYETPRCAISFKKSHPLNIFNENAFMTFVRDNDRFLRYPKPEIDKEAVKSAIKARELVPGAEIATNLNIQIK